jgi:hypothetical protein
MNLPKVRPKVPKPLSRSGEGVSDWGIGLEGEDSEGLASEGLASEALASEALVSRGSGPFDVGGKESFKELSFSE